MFVQTSYFTVKALTLNSLKSPKFLNEDRYESKNLLLCQNLYAEQDFSLKNATTQTTKDFRFRTSYLEKVDFKVLQRFEPI